MSAIYMLLVLLCASAGAAEMRGTVIECEPQRVIGDRRYWSWREIEGRVCWYPGRPGKPKNELHWSRPLPSEREQISGAVRPEVTVTPDDLVAVPVPVEEEKLTPAALMTVGVQRLLEHEPAKPPPMMPPLLPPAQKGRLPIWMLVVFVIATVGVAALFPIVRSIRNG
jgi:hypothetical protein